MPITDILEPQLGVEWKAYHASEWEAGGFGIHADEDSGDGKTAWEHQPPYV